MAIDWNCSHALNLIELDLKMCLKEKKKEIGAKERTRGAFIHCNSSLWKTAHCTEHQSNCFWGLFIFCDIFMRLRDMTTKIFWNWYQAHYPFAFSIGSKKNSSADGHLLQFIDLFCRWETEKETYFFFTLVYQSSKSAVGWIKQVMWNYGGYWKPRALFDLELSQDKNDKLCGLSLVSFPSWSGWLGQSVKGL